MPDNVLQAWQQQDSNLQALSSLTNTKTIGQFG